MAKPKTPNIRAAARSGLSLKATTASAKAEVKNKATSQYPGQGAKRHPGGWRAC